MVVPAGSSRPPARSIDGSCSSVNEPEHATTAATLSSIWSVTGRRSMRDVISVSTDDGISTLEMSRPSTSSTASCDVSRIGGLDSEQLVTRPLTKSGLPPELLRIMLETSSATRPRTLSVARTSSSMSSLRSSDSSISADGGSDSDATCWAHFSSGRVVSTMRSGAMRLLAWCSSAHEPLSIQWTSSNMSVVRMPPSLAASTWHIRLSVASLRCSPASCLVHWLSLIGSGSTGDSSGACCSSCSLRISSASACGRITHASASGGDASGAAPTPTPGGARGSSTPGGLMKATVVSMADLHRRLASAFRSAGGRSAWRRWPPPPLASPPSGSAETRRIIDGAAW